MFHGEVFTITIKVLVIYIVTQSQPKVSQSVKVKSKFHNQSIQSQLKVSPVGSCSSLMPPFQPEPSERCRATGTPGAKSQSPQPFCDEGPERCVARSQSRKKKKPFGDEGSEGERSKKPFQYEESEGSEGEPEDVDNANESVKQSSSIFDLGWHVLTTFVKSTAWSRHTAEEQQNKKRKRSYNNANRAATAKPKTDDSSLSTNGADDDRVTKLLGKDCECALANTLQFCDPVLLETSFARRQYVVSMSFMIRCRCNMLEAVLQEGSACLLERFLGAGQDGSRSSCAGLSCDCVI